MRQFNAAVVRSAVKAAIVGTVGSSLCSLILLSSAYARAAEPVSQSFDIGPQSLATALTDFARQSRQQILYAPELTAQKLSGGVRGTMRPLAALKILLKDSGLSFTNTPSGAILVGTPGSAALTSAAHNDSGNPVGAESATEGQKEGKKNSSDSFRVAQAPAGQASSTAAVGSQGGASQQDAVVLEEVIVTAEKRSERLQDVPIAVTVIKADTLVSNNQFRLQDYYTQVPGLTLTTDNRGAPSIAIRGLTDGAFTSQTTAVTVDDVTYSASSSVAYGWSTVEVDPNEVAAVEVLRGPQGTLYGASSLGGLIKYTTISPSMDGVSGRLLAGTSGVSNGHDLGINGSGAINVPLDDTMAVRLSGFARHEPGYITDVDGNRPGVNAANARGGRLSFLWQPSDSASVKFDALLQDRKSFGSSDVQNRQFSPNVPNPPLSDLEQNYLPGTGGYDRFLQIYDATIKAKIGDVDLTSVTSYGITSLKGNFDVYYNEYVYSITSPYYNLPGLAVVDDDVTHKFSQEIRLTGALGDRFDWLAGGFYTNESTSAVGAFWAAAVSGQLVDQAIREATTFVYDEYAPFADLTYHITDKFNVQVGGRESFIHISEMLVETGGLVPSPITAPGQPSSARAFTYLVTPQYKFSPDFMAYARFASGYRPGGINLDAALFKIPPSYDPDTTHDSEVGLRGNAFGHRLTFDASVYYIAWNKVQTEVPAQDGNNYIANAGAAKSEGVELNIGVTPIDGTSISGWVAYDNAVLTKPFGSGADTVALPGDRLPYASRISGNVALTQEIPIVDGWKGSIGGALSYVGQRLGEFYTPTQTLRQNLPEYAKLDLRAGIDHGPWTLTLYANNVTDRRGLLAGGVGDGDGSFVFITPRTVGGNVSFSF